jgi:hypothetical protein
LQAENDEEQRNEIEVRFGHQARNSDGRLHTEINRWMLTDWRYP